MRKNTTTAPLLAESFTDIESFEGTSCHALQNLLEKLDTNDFAITIASKDPKSEASKTEGEITAAKRIYQKVDLRNAVVTGDALHCERENMEVIIENAGDFHFQLKANQPTVLTEAQRIAAGGSPFLPTK